MLKEERYDKILSILEKDGYASAAKLSQQSSAGSMTAFALQPGKRNLHSSTSFSSVYDNFASGSRQVCALAQC